MNSKEIIEDIFEQPSCEFEHHLNLENNERIVFSGRYGIGKTTFLKHFFEKDENKGKYNAIHLFPVNYSILTNEDIFRYLKFDIVYDLLVTHGSKFQLEQKHFDYLNPTTTPLFVLRNLPRIAASLLLLIPKMGKQYHELSKEVGELAKKFESYHIATETNEVKLVESYIADFLKSEGEAYEFNIISELISKILQEIKGQDAASKKNILIVDDLDRIDPSHVFRIFNVFASHFDTRNEYINKFGFDHVVFVCDSKNIHSIFKNFYGSDVDFHGYIDKFYSQNVFHFDNTNNISGIIDRVVKSFVIKPDISIKEEKKFLEIVSEQLEFILSELVFRQQINLRSLFKLYGKHLILRSRPLMNNIVTNWNISIVISIQFMLHLFGDLDNLIKSLEACSGSYQGTFNTDESEYRRLLGDMLIVLTIKQHKFIPSLMHSNTDHCYVEKKEDIAIFGDIGKFGPPGANKLPFWGDATKVTDRKNGQNAPFSRCNYFQLLIDVIDELKHRKILP